MFSVIEIIYISEKLKDLVYCKIFIIISNLITIFRTVAAIYAVMTYQKVEKKLLCIKDMLIFCMAVVHGDNCVELFSFSVNSISSDK